MFSSILSGQGSSMSTFYKGDTYLEVASCFARTDLNDPQSFNAALEVTKCYVRSKLKKGRTVGARGGKLEKLEERYAHLGFQDVFYLTRLHLSLPPSCLSLPRPTSSTRKILLRAGFPLDDLEEEELAPVASSTSTVEEEVSRGRRSSIKNISQPSSRAASTRTIKSPPQPASDLAGSSRDLFNPSAESLPLTIRGPPLPDHDSLARLSANAPHSPAASQTSTTQAQAPQDVHVLEARIALLEKALQNLHTGQSPQQQQPPQPQHSIPPPLPPQRPMPLKSIRDRGSENSLNVRKHPGPPITPPPNMPLPPTPLIDQSNISPTSTISYRRTNASPLTSTTTRSPPTSPSLMFDLDDEIADDPFAAPKASAYGRAGGKRDDGGQQVERGQTLNRLERRQGALLRSISDLRIELRGQRRPDTPPPAYI